jgi:hypothetical protein
VLGGARPLLAPLVPSLSITMLDIRWVDKSGKNLASSYCPRYTIHQHNFGKKNVASTEQLKRYIAMAKCAELQTPPRPWERGRDRRVQELTSSPLSDVRTEGSVAVRLAASWFSTCPPAVRHRHCSPPLCNQMCSSEVAI